MSRIALGIEYCGSQYSGWQIQNGQASVQAALERALGKVANESIRVACAGRTDSGVHGVGQVVHFDSSAIRSEYNWLRGGNRWLPDDIAIRWVRNVADDFHARFSAQWRHYRYVLLNATAQPGLWRDRVGWYPQPLDAQRMSRAVECLLGEHDFTSFRAVACQAHSPVRTVHRISVQRDGRYIIFDIRANGFLHHMVRNIVGSLLVVGNDEQPEDWIQTVLDARNRCQAGINFQPHGLYFMAVGYPDQFQLPIEDPMNAPGILGIFQN